MTNTHAPGERQAASTFGIDRRTVLTTSAWAVPVVALAIASPAASASPVATKSALKLRNPAFQSNGAGYYVIYVQLEVDGTASDGPVSTASVSLVVTSADSPFTFDLVEVLAGLDHGWSEPILNPSTNTFALSWSGTPMQAGGGSYFNEPIGFKIHATSTAQPDSFTATATSTQAVGSGPVNQPVSFG